MQTRLKQPSNQLIVLLAAALVIILLAAPSRAQDATPELPEETAIPTDVPPIEEPPPLATDAPVEPTLEATPTELPPVEPPEAPTEVPSETPTEAPSDSPLETPTATPIETKTTEPVVDLPLAYSANFDTGFPVELGSGNGWLPIALEVGGAVQYSDGADAALYTLSTFTDSIVEARILLNSGDFTLSLRKTESNEYRAVLSSDGTLQLYKNDELVNAGSVPLTPGAWITLKFSAVGDQLSASVDGTEIVNATDFAPLPSGQVEFTASAGTLLRVDNFAIYGTGDGVPVIITGEPTPEATNAATPEATSEPTEDDISVSGMVFSPQFIGNPGTLTATTNQPSQINLSWTAITNAESYEIWRDSGDGGGSQLLTTVNAPATSYIDNQSGTGLLCSNTAQYKVRGFRTVGNETSAFTSVANGSTLACTAPTLTNPLTGSASQGGLQLQWSTVANTNNGYQIVISTDAAGSIPAAGYPKTLSGMSHTIDPLPDGTYYWKVRAANTTMNAYFGPFSAARTFIIDTQPLTGVPTPLTPISNATVNTVRPTFTWTAVTGAAYYQIEINPTVDFSVAAQFTSPLPGTAGAVTTTTYTLPENLPQGVYYWRARAYDAAKNAGGYSAAVPAFKADLKKTLADNAVIVLAGAAPTAPVTFTWAAIPNATPSTAYEVQIDTNDDGDFGDDSCLPIPSSALTCTKSFAPGRYAWRVLVDGEVPVTSHPTRSFIVSPPLPAAPTLDSPSATAVYSDNTPIQRNNLHFEWFSVSGASFYRFEIDNTSTFNTILEVNQTVPATPFANVDMSGFPAGTYYWRVKAVNSVGAIGPASAARPFVIDITPPAASPAQILPANGTVVNTVRPTFTYTSVTDPSTPVSYQVDISTSLTPDFDSNIITNAVSTTTTATLSSNLPAQGTYYWRVTAYDRAANGSTSGVIRSFTVNVSNLPAANAIAAPGNVTFTWATVPTASAYQVEIDEDSNGDFTNGTITTCTPATPTATTCTLARTAGTYPWRLVVTASEPVVNNPGNYRVLYVKTGAGLPAPTNVHLDAVGGVMPYDTDIYVNAAEKVGGINVAWSTPAAVPGLTIQKYIVEFSPTSAFTTISASTETPDGSTTQAAIPAPVLAADGTNKYARVRAVYNPATASSANTPSFWFVVNTQAPDAPNLLTPVPGRNSKAVPKAKLTWSAVTGIAPTNGYRLSVATNFNLTTEVLPGSLSIPLTATSYTFPVDLPLGSLFWRVNAVDVAGNVSSNSSTGDFMIFLGTAPAQSAVNQPMRPTFTWTTMTGATGYTLDVARDGDTSFAGNVYSYSTPDANTLSHVYPAAQPALGGIIYWRVYQSGTTPPAGYYASFSVTGGLTAPTLNPTDPVINQTEYATAQLSWNTPVGIGAGVYNYHIEVANTPAFSGAVEIGHFSASNATSINLSPAMDAQADGQKYWRVRAEYQPGYILGPYSATGTFTLDRVKPAKPIGLKVTFGTNPARPTLAWSAVTGIAPTNGYQIDLSEDNSFTTHVSGFPKLVSTPSSSIVAPLTLEQKTYYFLVRAIDAAGNVSLDSDTFTFNVNLANLPANNAVVNAPTGTVNQTFSWFAVPGAVGATSYRVQIDTDNDGDFVDNVITCPAAGTTTNLTCTVPGLARGTYIWRVLVNGAAVPGASIRRTLFVLNSAAMPVPGGVTLSEPGSIAPYYQDNLISEAESSGGVNLQWTAPAVIGATVVAYDIEYSATATFTSLLATDYGVVGLSAPIPTAALTDRTRYVRVRARYQSGSTNLPGTFSVAKLYTVDTVAPGVAAPTAPTNGLVVATRTPKLVWKPVTGAVRYQVILYPFSGPPAIVDTLVTGTSYTVPNALGLQNSIYFWTVTAIDAAGNSGIPSDIFSFRVNAP